MTQASVWVPTIGAVAFWVVAAFGCPTNEECETVAVRTGRYGRRWATYRKGTSAVTRHDGTQEKVSARRWLEPTVELPHVQYNPWFGVATVVYPAPQPMPRPPLSAESRDGRGVHRRGRELVSTR